MSDWFADFIKQDRQLWLPIIGHLTLRDYFHLAIVVPILAFGLWQTYTGNWTGGLLIPLWSWSMRIVSDLERVGGIEHQINQKIPAVQSLREAVSIEPDIVDTAGAIALPSDQPPRIEFTDVSYSYAPDDPQQEEGDFEVLTGLSFTVEPGERVALIGEKGSGKSTVIKLALRFMDPTTGRVLVNGQDLREISLESWRRLIGYVPQQSSVFNGTLRDNLLYAIPRSQRNGRDDEQLTDLLGQLNVDFGDERFKTQRFDTIVGENGVKLSGGQAQLLSLVAAAAHSPQVLVLDEATSSLDSSTEKRVQVGLENLLSEEQGRSAIIIAHRLDTLRMCNKFLVLNPPDKIRAGRPQIEARAGSFEELYDCSKIFKRLADDQSLRI